MKQSRSSSVFPSITQPQKYFFIKAAGNSHECPCNGIWQNAAFSAVGSRRNKRWKIIFIVCLLEIQYSREETVQEVPRLCGRELAVEFSFWFLRTSQSFSLIALEINFKKYWLEGFSPFQEPKENLFFRIFVTYLSDSFIRKVDKEASSDFLNCSDFQAMKTL